MRTEICMFSAVNNLENWNDGIGIQYRPLSLRTTSSFWPHPHPVNHLAHCRDSKNSCGLSTNNIKLSLQKYLSSSPQRKSFFSEICRCFFLISNYGYKLDIRESSGCKLKGRVSKTLSNTFTNSNKNSTAYLKFYYDEHIEKNAQVIQYQ